MPSTLRGEVEALAAALERFGEVEHAATELRAILSRHAEEVSVPRELLLRLRNDSETLRRMTHRNTPVSVSMGDDVAQADAILKGSGNAKP